MIILVGPEKVRTQLKNGRKKNEELNEWVKNVEFVHKGSEISFDDREIDV